MKLAEWIDRFVSSHPYYWVSDETWLPYDLTHEALQYGQVPEESVATTAGPHPHLEEVTRTGLN